MSEETTPRNIVRTALLSLWGLITLILVFMLAMIIYDRYQQGLDPLAFVIDDEKFSTAQLAKVTKEVVPEKISEVNIYFAAVDSMYVRPESHHLALGESTARNCEVALQHIIDGPMTGQLAPVVSNKTEVRALYLMENGELVIDFSRSLESGHIKSTTAELLMIRSITQTLFQESLRGAKDLRVSSIRFLFEGTPYQQSFPAHIDLSEPIESDSIPGATIEPA
jgi:hypothetical protein